MEEYLVVRAQGKRVAISGYFMSPIRDIRSSKRARVKAEKARGIEKMDVADVRDEGSEYDDMLLS